MKKDNNDRMLLRHSDGEERCEKGFPSSRKLNKQHWTDF